MYDTDALLLPFLQLIILSVSQCLKILYWHFTCEQEKNANSLSIIFFFMDLSISVPI